MLTKQRSGWTGRAPGRRGARAQVLLGALGVKAHAPNRRFWEQPWWELQRVLNDAAKVYRSKAVATHPDAGGSVEDMQSLNVLWDQLRRVFAKRGFTPE